LAEHPAMQKTTNLTSDAPIWPLMHQKLENVTNSTPDAPKMYKLTNSTPDAPELHKNHEFDAWEQKFKVESIEIH
jgi:hypothetical protein